MSINENPLHLLLPHAIFTVSHNKMIAILCYSRLLKNGTSVQKGIAVPVMLFIFIREVNSNSARFNWDFGRLDM